MCSSLGLAAWNLDPMGHFPPMPESYVDNQVGGDDSRFENRVKQQEAQVRHCVEKPPHPSNYAGSATSGQNIVVASSGDGAI